jgi:hypothetical protein
MNQNAMIMNNLIKGLTAEYLPLHGVAKGNERGFNYTIALNRNFIIWQFSVKPTTLNVDKLNELSNTIRSSVKCFKGLSYDSFTITLTLTNRHFNKESQQIAALMYEFLSTNEYVNCCCKCGKTDSVALYGIDNRQFGLYLCDDCANAIIAQMQQSIEEMEQKEERVFVGTLGAALGTIPGILLAMLLYYLGFIAGIAGLLIVSGSLYLYERFAGKLTKKGVIIAVIFTILAIVVVQPMLSYSIELFTENEFYRTYPYIYSLIDIPFIIFSTPSLLGYYAMEVLIGLGLAALASYQKIRQTLVEKTSASILHQI